MVCAFCDALICGRKTEKVKQVSTTGPVYMCVSFLWMGSASCLIEK